MDLRMEVGGKGKSGNVRSKGKGSAPYKKQSRPFLTYEEKKELTRKNVEREVEKEKGELGEEEYWKRINERIRLHNVAAMESVREEEERRERVLKEGREMARRKLERLERGEEDDEDNIADNDILVTPPSPDTIRKGNASFGGPTTEFKDVRIKDAQREAAASENQRRVEGSGDKGGRGEGGLIPSKYLQKESGEERMDESDCTPYEEDEEDEGERERERERERVKEERRFKKEKRSGSSKDSYRRSSPRQAGERTSPMDEKK